MNVILENISKRYIHDWIFKNISVEIKDKGKWAIIGPNGSGKSTLLQIISSFRLPSSGMITFSEDRIHIPADEMFDKVSFASPYLDLIEEFTLKELLDFHFSWRNKLMDKKEIIDLFHLHKAVNKPIKYFSSGMKQRLKLALAFSTDSSLLMFDEPTAYLDKAGVAIYNDCLKNLLHNRILIIASNDPNEYEICDNFIKINDYK